MVPRASITCVYRTVFPVLLMLTGVAGAAPHSADVDGDYAISLGELLRVVQLREAGTYHCDVMSEDGYALGPGDLLCGFHDSDFVSVDGIIGTRELLRLIQIYYAGRYHDCAAAGDGFCLGEDPGEGEGEGEG